MSIATPLQEGLKNAPDYDNPRCLKCGYCTTSHAPFVQPQIRAGLVLIVPSPFTGDGSTLGEAVEWDMLKSIMESLNVPDYSIASLVRCAPIKKRTIGKTAVNMCSPFLFQALNKHERGPRILFGAETLHAVVSDGISMEHAVGRVFETAFGEALVTHSIREYFRNTKGTNNEAVLNVGILEVITAHIKHFIRGTVRETFPVVQEI